MPKTHAVLEQKRLLIIQSSLSSGRENYRTVEIRTKLPKNFILGFFFDIERK